MRKTVWLLILLGCWCADGEEFSASHNLTLAPYKIHYRTDSPFLVAFSASFELYNASELYVGSALIRTTIYSETEQQWIYVNYTVPMPEMGYKGAFFEHRIFNYYKILDPCLTTEFVANADIDFPDAWTNAQSGQYYTTSNEEHFRAIKSGFSWSTSITSSDCSRWPNNDQPECTQYYIWNISASNYTNYMLTVDSGRSQLPIMDVLKRIHFRHVGSKTCPMGMPNTINKDYSFTIDFTTATLTSWNILLHDMPLNENVTFIVNIEASNYALLRNIWIELSAPYVTEKYVPTPERIYLELVLDLLFFVRDHQPEILCLLLIPLLLITTGIGICINKRNRQRALRVQYEHIPDDNSSDYNNTTRDQYMTDNDNSDGCNSVQYRPSGDNNRVNYQQLLPDGDNVVNHNNVYKSRGYDEQNLIVSE